MSIKVKRIIALSVCAALLAVAIIQNVRSAKQQAGEIKPTAAVNAKPVENTNASEEFFAKARLDRESERAAAEAECAAIIADSESTDAEITEANELSKSLAAMTETENNLEAVIAGRGYKDVLVLLSEEGEMEITVSKAEIDEAEVAAIAQLAQESAGISIDNLCLKCFNSES